MAFSRGMQVTLFVNEIMECALFTFCLCLLILLHLDTPDCKNECKQSKGIQEEETIGIPAAHLEV